MNVKEVRDLISKVEGFKSVEVIERERNYGLANSIIDGVSKLSSKYGKVIVFEDDLISSPYTLKYFNEALELYENRSEIMHIGAYMYPLKEHKLPEAFFLRMTSSWGWATWKRAWTVFESDIDTLMRQFSSEDRNAFEMEGAMNYWQHMKDFKAGKNSSWAIRWYASVFLNKGLALYPAHSLIDNIGHDGTGVHSGLNDIFKVPVSQQPILKFPDTIRENAEAFALVKDFLRNRKGNLWQRGLRYVKQLSTKLIRS